MPTIQDQLKAALAQFLQSETQAGISSEAEINSYVNKMNSLIDAMTVAQQKGELNDFSWQFVKDIAAANASRVSLQAIYKNAAGVAALTFGIIHAGLGALTAINPALGMVGELAVSVGEATLESNGIIPAPK